MNIGDKVVCHTNRIYITNHNTGNIELMHTKNKTYIISKIENDFLFITSDIKDNNSDKYQTFQYVNEDVSIYFIFKDYFTPLKELRKLKLQKITNNVQI